MFTFDIASQLIAPDISSVKTLNKQIFRTKKEIYMELKFFSIESQSIRVAVFSDASFPSNPDHTSRLGFVIVFADRHVNANILQYSSFKSKRFTLSLFVSKLFSALHAFDYVSTLRATINDFFDQFVPHVLYTDSKSPFESVVGLTRLLKKVC